MTVLFSAKEAKDAVTPGRKVARNTPLTSTMKEDGELFNPPTNLTQIAETNFRNRGYDFMSYNFKISLKLLIFTTLTADKFD